VSEQPAEVLDAQVIEEAPPVVPPLGELVPAGGNALAVTPQVQATELVERLAVIKQAADEAMTKGVDYGEIPGTKKPTLLKPGAEKLSVLFQLDVQIQNEKEWGPGDHLTVTSKAVAFHAPSGTRLGYGEGICTTRERKYAYRKKERACPKCGAEAIIKGKQEYGGGWVCWKKKDGCDAKFSDGDQSIEGQEAGEVENPDLPDLWNTVVKMAEKRARVDVVLAVTGASALFTQDIEDGPGVGATVPPQSNSGASKASTSSTGFNSDAQRNLFERVLGDAGFNTAGIAEVCDFVRSTKTKGEISKLIDAIKDKSTRTETADQLGRDAKEWTATQNPETPAPVDPPDTDGEEIPF
jgi:hypothetical protein